MSRLHRYLAPTTAFACIPVPLDPLHVLGVARPACPACHAEMAVHQPDPGLPDRLLATCEGCKAWWLIDRRAGLMLLLPDGPGGGT